MTGLLTLYTKIYKITWSIFITWKSVLTSDSFDLWPQFWRRRLTSATLLKTDSGTGAFLWILRSFYRTPSGDCFWWSMVIYCGYIVVKYYLNITKKQKSKIWLTPAIVTSEYSFDMSKKTETLFLCSCYKVLFLSFSGLECIGRQ